MNVHHQIYLTRLKIKRPHSSFTVCITIDYNLYYIFHRCNCITTKVSGSLARFLIKPHLFNNDNSQFYFTLFYFNVQLSPRIILLGHAMHFNAVFYSSAFHVMGYDT